MREQTERAVILKLRKIKRACICIKAVTAAFVRLPENWSDLYREIIKNYLIGIINKPCDDSKILCPVCFREGYMNFAKLKVSALINIKIVKTSGNKRLSGVCINKLIS